MCLSASAPGQNLTPLVPLRRHFISHHDGLSVQTDTPPPPPRRAPHSRADASPGPLEGQVLPLGHWPLHCPLSSVGCVPTWPKLLLGKSQECWIYLCSHLIPSRSQYIGYINEGRPSPDPQSLVGSVILCPTCPDCLTTLCLFWAPETT